MFIGGAKKEAEYASFLFQPQQTLPAGADGTGAVFFGDAGGEEQPQLLTEAE